MSEIKYTKGQTVRLVAEPRRSPEAQVNLRLTRAADLFDVMVDGVRQRHPDDLTIGDPLVVGFDGPDDENEVNVIWGPDEDRRRLWLDAECIEPIEAEQAEPKQAEPEQSNPMVEPFDVEQSPRVVALKSAIDVIGQALMSEANDRDWCSDYDDFVTTVNRMLKEYDVALPVRSRTYEVEVPITMTYSVEATDQDDALNKAYNLLRSQVLDRSWGREAIEVGGRNEWGVRED